MECAGEVWLAVPFKLHLLSKSAIGLHDGMVSCLQDRCQSGLHEVPTEGVHSQVVQFDGVQCFADIFHDLGLGFDQGFLYLGWHQLVIDPQEAPALGK